MNIRCLFGAHDWSGWVVDPMYERVQLYHREGIIVRRQLLTRSCERCGKYEETTGAMTHGIERI